MEHTNGLLEYFVDPYPECERVVTLCKIPEFSEKELQHIRRMEENLRRMASFLDKKDLNIFQIANYKTEIDDYFESKHSQCTHPKKTNWQRFLDQFRHLHK